MTKTAEQKARDAANQRSRRAAKKAAATNGATFPRTATTHTCRTCHKTQPATRYPTRNPEQRDTQCRTCRNGANT